MQPLKLRQYSVMVDDTDVDIMRQIMKEMENTLNTLPVENMTIKNVFQQIINEAETNKQGN
tara:strand:+ start:315 stop:497 length:183 start_codon:yes stop_codon:yes gene_type:complete